MVMIENANFSKKVRRMLGFDLDSWNNILLLFLSITAVAAAFVGLATYATIQLAKQEAADSKRDFEAYKLTVEGQVADAKKEGIRAGETAGNALVRAAQLEREAANARLETEKLKAVVAWRTISASENAAIERILSAKPGSVNLRWTDGDPEALFFAIQISQVLQRAHWSVASGSFKPANGILFGFILPPALGNDVQTLRDAFTAARLPFSAVPLPQQGMSLMVSTIPDAPFLMVGSRMPVVP
jgi:hypothetical protein